MCARVCLNTGVGIDNIGPLLTFISNAGHIPSLHDCNTLEKKVFSKIYSQKMPFWFNSVQRWIVKDSQKQKHFI